MFICSISEISSPIPLKFWYKLHSNTRVYFIFNTSTFRTLYSDLGHGRLRCWASELWKLWHVLSHYELLLIQFTQNELTVSWGLAVWCLVFRFYNMYDGLPSRWYHSIIFSIEIRTFFNVTIFTIQTPNISVLPRDQDRCKVFETSRC